MTNRIRIINGFFVLLAVWLTAFSGFAQQPKEPFQQAWEQAALAMRQKNYDAAIEFYTVAINLFPKFDAYTPKNKKLDAGSGKFIETPYTGLDALYSSRARAHLNKSDLKQAENDFTNALNVLKSEITKNLDSAKSYRRRADIKEEKRSEYADIYNTNLARAAFSFAAALQVCEKAKSFNYRRREEYRSLRIKLSPDEENIAGFNEIVKYKEEAFFGRTEALATSIIETGNKGHYFPALQSANEFVAAFPNNIEAYRLRAKVHRQWGRDESALADEEKVRQLSAGK